MTIFITVHPTVTNCELVFNSLNVQKVHHIATSLKSLSSSGVTTEKDKSELARTPMTSLQ